MDHRQADSFHIPRWEELPAVDLYMEQVITLIHSNLGAFFEQVGIQPITKNMINNYVKAKIVQAPVNKRYPRISVAMIIVVYILKSCYETEDVGKLIRMGVDLEAGVPLTYNRFCDAIENAVKAVFSGEVHIKEEQIPGRERKYLMENFALSFASKYYVQMNFLNNEE
ncbi:MAG: DUF1836 domain-containing protein [Firmicutes bacterium]|nr:DUF1836 domain-containing protein [Bacillota bacterium]MBQ1580005.1 DUF1836 domain-containing protein [Bacillota bacterium]MBQ2084475.1 DUF1836 domain-containing protein [Bacillota bacterium]MBQ2218862.1 DUF1836 domain-containing protein [Bacillota bacterium]MBQ2228064.1 DUF1836 domain-containing protein [Bacillota bacterium]